MSVSLIGAVHVIQHRAVLWFYSAPSGFSFVEGCLLRGFIGHRLKFPILGHAIEVADAGALDGEGLSTRLSRTVVADQPVRSLLERVVGSVRLPLDDRGSIVHLTRRRCQRALHALCGCLSHCSSRDRQCCDSQCQSALHAEPPRNLLLIIRSTQVGVQPNLSVSLIDCERDGSVTSVWRAPAGVLRRCHWRYAAEPPAPPQQISNLQVRWGRRFRLPASFSATFNQVNPFTLECMPSITLEDARRVIAAAEKKAAEIGQPMNIAIADEGGNLVAHVRMDGAWLGSIDISIKKAYTSRAFDIATKDLATHSQSGGQFFGIHASNDGKIMIFAGGVPLKKKGKVVGAIGVSGGSGDQDHAVAEAGAKSF